MTREASDIERAGPLRSGPRFIRFTALLAPVPEPVQVSSALPAVWVRLPAASARRPAALARLPAEPVPRPVELGPECSRQEAEAWS